MVIRPDDDLDNADWTKGTWDLGDPDAYAAHVGTWTREQAAAFKKRPAYRAAPAVVKDAVAAALRR